MVVSPNERYFCGGPYNKDYSILVPILGSPYFGKLPYGGRRYMSYSQYFHINDMGSSGRLCKAYMRKL